jgi:hypothetical protein
MKPYKIYSRFFFIFDVILTIDAEQNNSKIFFNFPKFGGQLEKVMCQRL